MYLWMYGRTVQIHPAGGNLAGALSSEITAFEWYTHWIRIIVVSFRSCESLMLIDSNSISSSQCRIPEHSPVNIRPLSHVKLLSAISW